MRTKWFVVGSLLLLCTLSAFGQTLGEVTGQVADPAGASITGANVTITNVNTNASRSAITNEAGVYSFPALPPGTYNLRVEKTGFKSANSNQVDVQVQQTV